MTDTTDTRERLREKLRAKRRERTGDSAPSRVDNVRRAEELVLNSFGDNVDALRMMTNALQNPTAALSQLTKRNVDPTAEEEEAPPCSVPSVDAVSDDEEAPPSFRV